MTVSVGVVMDPIGSIKPWKDSTLAMLLEAQRRDWAIWYLEQADLHLTGNRVLARCRALSVRDDNHDWYEFGAERTVPLGDLDVVLMRKDPPFDTEYIYTTYLLEQAEVAGTLVVNGPSALRDLNEKLATAWFPEFCPATLVSRRPADFRDFLAKHRDMVVKPLDGMGGASVFRVRLGDPNTNVIIETLTHDGHRFAMAQVFLPEIRDGDKRILLIDGEPAPYALARIPAEGENRGNLAAGASGVGVTLTERDRRIAVGVGAELRRRGVLFAGIDVIGDYLTEVNITSPTCIRELDALYDINIAADLLDRIEQRLDDRKASR